VLCPHAGDDYDHHVDRDRGSRGVDSVPVVIRVQPSTPGCSGRVVRVVSRRLEFEIVGSMGPHKQSWRSTVGKKKGEMRLPLPSLQGRGKRFPPTA
jgi:hypothetical protein